MPLTRLLYTSTFCVPDSEVPVDQLVQEIAEDSAERNARNSLTGVLVFIQNQFIQVLEGEGTQIEETFERICCDLRHKNVRLVDLVPVKERMFPDWKMKVLSATQEDTVVLRDDLENIRFLVGVNARAAVEQIRKCLDARQPDAFSSSLIS